MAIRACSYMDEVVVGKAKELFRRFRRLGVYEWPDVLRTAQGNPDNEIMAFRFSRTELFSTPIPWEEARTLIEEHDGRQSHFQSPTRISESCFFAMYRRGCNGVNDAS